MFQLLSSIFFTNIAALLSNNQRHVIYCTNVSPVYGNIVSIWSVILAVEIQIIVQSMLIFQANLILAYSKLQVIQIISWMAENRVTNSTKPLWMLINIQNDSGKRQKSGSYPVGCIRFYLGLSKQLHISRIQLRISSLSLCIFSALHISYFKRVTINCLSEL